MGKDLGHLHSLDGLRHSSYLVDLQQQGVAGLPLDGLLDALRIGHQQIISDHLQQGARSSMVWPQGQRMPRSPGTSWGLRRMQASGRGDSHGQGAGTWETPSAVKAAVESQSSWSKGSSMVMMG